MAKKQNKLSINKFEQSLTKDVVVKQILDGTEDVEIEIKKMLTLDEALSFIQEVVESCIDSETGEYLPEAYDFSVRVGVLTHYSNISLPASTDKKYWYVYNSGAFDQILSTIDNLQFNDLIRTIDRKIKYLTDMMVSTAAGKIGELVSKFSDVAEKLKGTFDDMDPAVVQGIVEKLSKIENIDQDGLVRTIMSVRSVDDKEGTTDNTVIIPKESVE